MPTGFVLQTPDGATYAVNSPLRLGRDFNCQVVLADERVSRHHATCWSEGGRLFLRDEQSSNGTYVNGRRLERGEVATLQPGDQLQLGGTHLLAGLAAEPIQSTPAPVPPPGAPPPAATVKMRLPDQPRRRRTLPLVLGCGLAALVLGCAAVVVGALATGALPMTFGPSPTSGLSASGTPLPPGAVTPATTSDPNVTPAGPDDLEVPLTPETILPVATPLALDDYAAGSASLGAAVADLNTAELRFVQDAAAGIDALTLDARLQAVAAAAMRVGGLAQQLGVAAAGQPPASETRTLTAESYNGVARLAFALVVDATNAHDALALGQLTADQAARIIAEYGARLWQPGFDAPPAANPPPDLSGRVAHSPFLTYTTGALPLVPVQYLSPEAAATVLGASGEDGTLVQSWLAVSGETFTKTLNLRPLGVPPANPFDPALLASLSDAAAYADPTAAHAARAVAAAHLALLTGSLNAPVQAALNAPRGLARLWAFQPPAPGLIVPLFNQAAVGGSNANPALPAIRGGHVTPLLKSPFQIIQTSFRINQDSQPEIIAQERVANPAHSMVLTIDGVGSASAAGISVEPGRDGLAIRLKWARGGNFIDPTGRDEPFMLVCSAAEGPTGVAYVNGPQGEWPVALILPIGVPHTVTCFMLANFAGTAGGGIGGLVVAQTETFSVVLPGLGPDADHDGVPDTDDDCPNEAEDRDKIADDDGCPETDVDNDGVLDNVDGCPGLAGPKPIGCPTNDQDSDGIEDYKDECPLAAEDKDGVRDSDGCPENDADLDGYGDQTDTCPDNAEDFDKFKDEDGCQDYDNDEDGLPDAEDFCPVEAETFNKYLDDDGCADTWPQLIVVTTFSEAAADLYHNGFTFQTNFNLVVDYATGTVAGAVTGSANATVKYTCFNVDNPSELYDRAEAYYSLSYTASVSGAGLTPGASVAVPFAPVGNAVSTGSQPFTDERCTHLNSGLTSGAGPFTGEGTLTIDVDEFNYVGLLTVWSTPAFSVTGSGEVRGSLK